MTILKNPRHPGEVLKYLFIEPSGLRDDAWVKSMNFDNITQVEVCLVLLGAKPITKRTANAIGKATNTTPEMWMNMQENWDAAQEENK